MSAQRIGVAVCGSYCTFSTVIPEFKKLADEGFDLVPIMSFNAYSTDTRFGKAADFVAEIEKITGKTVIHTIEDAEPIGPKKLLDLLLIAPCTGNTLAKLACGITDTPVTMAAKAHMRNSRPILIAVSTNDALSVNAKNIGLLMSMKNVFFVPLRQDNPQEKPTSIVADMSRIPEAVHAALNGRQLQPMLIA